MYATQQLHSTKIWPCEVESSGKDILMRTPLAAIVREPSPNWYSDECSWFRIGVLCNEKWEIESASWFGITQREKNSPTQLSASMFNGKAKIFYQSELGDIRQMLERQEWDRKLPEDSEDEEKIEEETEEKTEEKTEEETEEEEEEVKEEE